MSNAAVISFFNETTQTWQVVSDSFPLPVLANVVANVGADATAANPVYVEGTANPISQTLFGGLRVTLLEPDGTPYTAGGGLEAIATAANPAYVEGSSDPLSMTLDGYLRSNSRQSGSWIVGQDGPWAVQQDGAWTVSVTGTVEIEGAGVAGVPAGGVVSMQGVAGGTPVPVDECAEFEACPASATTTLGGAGAAGDDLFFLTIFPGTTSPGNVIVLNNAVAIATFPGGANSVSNLVPFILPVYAKSVGGAWSVTCGANVTALASGRFT